MEHTARKLTDGEILLRMEQNQSHIKRVEERLEGLIGTMIRVGIGVIGTLAIGLGSIVWAIITGGL